jgi:hypothetical protein
VVLLADYFLQCHGCATITAPRHARLLLLVQKWEKLFPLLTPGQRSRITMDEVALFSVSDQRSAAQTTDIISALPRISSSSRITDGSACVGGNTVSFATRFAHVHAVELAHTRAEALRLNCDVLGVSSRVTVYEVPPHHASVFLESFLWRHATETPPRPASCPPVPPRRLCD